MAQPRARGGQTEQTGGASSARNSTPSTESSAPPARRFNLSRFVLSRVDRTPNSPAPRLSLRERIDHLSGVWKLMITMAVILVAAPLGNALLVLMFNALHLSYTQVLISKGVPLIGGMTLFTLFYLIFIVLIYIALFKFNIFPRDLFGAKAKAEARARERAAQNASNASSNARASRRASTRHVTTTSSASPSARRVAAAARTETQPTITGDYDAEHARVKAAQRARRRRETRK